MNHEKTELKQLMERLNLGISDSHTDESHLKLLEDARILKSKIYEKISE